MTEQIKQRIEMIRRGEVPEGYKKTKIGIVPVDWQNIRFATLFKSTSNYTEDLSKYPLFSLTIENGVTEKTERYERSHLVKKSNSYKIVLPNHFAYNPMNIRFGAVSRHKGKKPVAVSGYYDIFTTVNESDLTFMDSFLTSSPMMTYYNNVSTGSLIEKQRVHFSRFLEFYLPLPSQMERKRIAEILTTCDKLIELKERLITEKQKQKKYLIQMLLTGKKRLDGYTGKWKKDIVGSYLSESKVVAASDISKRITVKLALKGVEKRLPRSFEKDDVTTQYVRKAGQYIYGKQNLHHGAMGIVPSELDGFQSSSDLPSFDFSTDIEPFWFYYYFSRAVFYTNLENIATGTGSKRIQPEQFYKIKIMVPPIEEQKAIATILSVADHEIELLQKDLEQEKQKKKALMQLLLTGIVRV